VQNALAEKVIGIVADGQQIPRERITLDSSFEELGIDSLAGLSIVADLENEFRIDIPTEEVLRIRTVREVVESLAKALAGGATGAEAPLPG
jgi:acyl carrier protein